MEVPIKKLNNVNNIFLIDILFLLGLKIKKYIKLKIVPSIAVFEVR